MRAFGLFDGGKARQPVGKHGTPRRQAGLGPLLDSLEGEAGDGGEFIDKALEFTDGRKPEKPMYSKKYMINRL